MKKWVIWSSLILSLIMLSGCGMTDWTVNTVNSLFIGTFALIGLWYVFWPVIFCGFVFLSWLIEDTEGHPFFVLFSVGFYISIIQFSSEVDLVLFIKESTALFALYMAVYVVCGVLYAYYRLYIEGLQEKNNFLEKKKEFLAKNDYNEEKWVEEILENEYKYKKPELINKKKKIISRIIYWPYSIFWYFFHDLVKDVAECVYNLLKESSKKVYEHAIGREVLSDFKKAEEIRATRKKAHQCNYKKI